MEKDPLGTSLSEGMSSLNIVKNITWSIKETYSTCGHCDKHFSQFSVRKSCQLCRSVFCKACGTSSICFSTDLFPKMKPMDGTLQLNACIRCRLSLALQSRRQAIQWHRSSQRIEQIQERHSRVQAHRDSIDSLLEDFFSFKTLTPAAVEVSVVALEL